MSEIKIGRMLRAGMSGFVVGCQIDKIDVPSFGSLVRAPVGEGAQVYGLVHDLHVDDDGLVRQLATAPEVEESTIQDAQRIATCLWRSACLQWVIKREIACDMFCPPARH